MVPLEVVRPVLPMVQRLHVEVRVDSGFLARHRHFNGMRPDPPHDPVAPCKLDELAEEIYVSVRVKTIPHAALHVDAACPGVDGPLCVGREVCDFRLDLRDPLNLAAAFLPVGGDQLQGMAVKPKYRRVDSVLLAELERLEHHFVREVPLQQSGNVHQVPAVREPADEVSAADDPAYLELSYPAPGQGFGCFLCRFDPRGLSCQQDLVFQAEAGRYPPRDPKRPSEKLTATFFPTGHLAVPFVFLVRLPARGTLACFLPDCTNRRDESTGLGLTDCWKSEESY